MIPDCRYKSMIDIPELLDITFSNLDTLDLLACGLVSRSWYQLALPHLWHFADSNYCNSMWPCIHQSFASENTALIPLLEQYGCHMWHMRWPLGWMSMFVGTGRPSCLKTLCIPAFNGAARITSPELTEPFLEDVPITIFGRPLPRSTTVPESRKPPRGSTQDSDQLQHPFLHRVCDGPHGDG